MKKKLFSILFFLLLYCFFELSALLGLVALKKFRHLEYNPVLTSSFSPVSKKTLEDMVAGKTTYLLHSPAWLDH
jgi:hypothetical protein